MKKTLALILAMLMIAVCFTACGDTQSEDSTTSPGVESIKIPEGEDLMRMHYLPYH